MGLFTTKKRSQCHDKGLTNDFHVVGKMAVACRNLQVIAALFLGCDDSLKRTRRPSARNRRLKVNLLGIGCLRQSRCEDLPAIRNVVKCLDHDRRGRKFVLRRILSSKQQFSMTAAWTIKQERPVQSLYRAHGSDDGRLYAYIGGLALDVIEVYPFRRRSGLFRARRQWELDSNRARLFAADIHRTRACSERNSHDFGVCLVDAEFYGNVELFHGHVWLDAIWLPYTPDGQWH